MEREIRIGCMDCGKEMYVCQACGEMRCECTTPSHWLWHNGEKCNVCERCHYGDPKTCKCDNCLGRKGGE